MGVVVGAAVGVVEAVVVGDVVGVVDGVAVGGIVVVGEPAVDPDEGVETAGFGVSQPAVAAKAKAARAIESARITSPRREQEQAPRSVCTTSKLAQPPNTA